MTITADMIMTDDGQLLPFARDLREALAVYARRTWPVSTSGHAARAWGIPKATAANLLKGHASDATITAILRAGGWPVALAVVGAVIGQGFDTFINTERERLNDVRRAYEARDRELAEVASDLGACLGLADRRAARMAAAARRPLRARRR